MSALRSVACVMVTVMASACALYEDTGDEAPSDETPDDETPGETPTIPLVADANGCHVVAALDGSTAMSSTFGPYVFGTATFCLHLDGSQLHRGHFMANTRYQAGDASGFSLEMTDANGSPLGSGWDVSVGHTDTKTFANLEMAVAGGTVLEVRLVVTATDKTSTVNVALFDPLD